MRFERASLARLGKALEICNQGSVMHPRKRGHEELECAEDAFDGEQRCAPSGDPNAPHDSFLSKQGSEGPLPAPRPPEDVIRAKLTVILRLWRPVTGCFELKQKTHCNPKRPWKDISAMGRLFSQPETLSLLSFPFRRSSID